MQSGNPVQSHWSDADACGFACRLEDHGHAPAIVDETGLVVDYQSLASRADAFAARLGTIRRLVVIEAANDIEAIAAYLGALRGRHPVLFTASAEATRALSVAYPPGAVFSRGEHGWRLELRPADVVLHDDLALLLSTSGSTGSPKLVRLSHDALDANASAIADYLDIRPGDRAMTTLPIHYSYGLSVVNSHLAVGAAILLTDRSVTDPAFWAMAERLGATSIAGVPYTYELLDRVGFTDMRLPSLRTLTQAGGRLPPERTARYARWAEARGIRFFVMYGQTEATARMAYVPPVALQDHPDCIGVAIPGGQFTLVDADGGTITADEVPGELVYSGPNVMMGYAISPADLARGAETDALFTGDIACRSAGMYRIVGRKSRIAKLFGLRISLDEIEAMLARRGWPAAVAGDDALIAVSLTGDIDPAVVAGMLATTLKLPLSVVHVAAAPEHPRLPSGKIDYRQILASARIAPSAAVDPPPSDRAAALTAAFERAFAGRTITPDDSFASLGGDSLSYITFSIEIEDQVGSLPDHWETATLGELQAFARRRGLAPPPTRRRGVEAEVVLRALAIVAVVINHASTLVVGGGANVLLLLAGYNIARFQRTRLEQGDVMPMLANFAGRIILPYYAILIAYLMAKREIDWSAIFLVGNFTGHFRSFIEPYWFLEALLQCMILIAVLFSIPPIRHAARRDPWQFGVVLLGIAVAIKLLPLAGLDPRDYGRTPDEMFYLLAFGWCLNFATTSARKALLFALIVGECGLQLAAPADVAPFWRLMPWPTNIPHGLWLVGAAAALLWHPKLSLPRWLHAPITTIATASFYIYLVSGVTIYLMVTALKLDALPVTLALSVAAGVIASEAVSRAQAVLARARPAGRAAAQRPVASEVQRA